MRYRSLTAALAVLASGLILGQQSAEAAPTQTTATCSPGIPSKLVVARPDAYVEFRLGRDCPRTMISGSWDVTRPDGYSTGFGCGVGQVCRTDLYELPIGAVTWKPTTGIGWDRNGRKVADLLPANSTVKAGAAIGLTGVRSGTKTTVYARASATTTPRPSRSPGTTAACSSRSGTSARPPGPTSAGPTPTPQTGAASYTITTNRARDYRVYVPSSSTVWYAYSATKRV